MCGYVVLTKACGCQEIFYDTSCSRILQQLNRINEPEAWQPDTIATLPFDMPVECEPSWHNTTWRGTTTFCAGYYLDCPTVARALQLSRQIAAGTVSLRPAHISEATSPLQRSDQSSGTASHAAATDTNPGKKCP